MSISIQSSRGVSEAEAMEVPVNFYSTPGDPSTLGGLGDGDWGSGSGDGTGGDGAGDGYGDYGNDGDSNGSASVGAGGSGSGVGKKNGHGHLGGSGGKPKKLSLACHFCRRRKLKCDGQRPVCETCTKRSEICSWDDNVRRRGPGKATKERREKAAREAMAAGMVNDNSMSVPLHADLGHHDPHGQEHLGPYHSEDLVHDHNHIQDHDHHQHQELDDSHQHHQVQEHDESLQHQLNLDIDPTLIALSAVMPETLAELERVKDEAGHHHVHAGHGHGDEEEAALAHLNQHHPEPQQSGASLLASDAAHLDQSHQVEAAEGEHDEFAELHRAAKRSFSHLEDDTEETKDEDEEDERDKRLRLDEGLVELPSGLPDGLEELDELEE